VDAIATTLVGTGVDDPVKVGVVLSAAGVCTMAGPDVCGIDGVFGGVGTCAVKLAGVGEDFGISTGCASVFSGTAV